jgi:hypothetical protein
MIGPSTSLKMLMDLKAMPPWGRSPNLQQPLLVASGKFRRESLFVGLGWGEHP